MKNLTEWKNALEQLPIDELKEIEDSLFTLGKLVLFTREFDSSPKLSAIQTLVMNILTEKERSPSK